MPSKVLGFGPAINYKNRLFLKLPAIARLTMFEFVFIREIRVSPFHPFRRYFLMNSR